MNVSEQYVTKIESILLTADLMSAARMWKTLFLG